MMKKVLTMQILFILILFGFLLLPAQAAVDTNNQVIVESITQITFNGTGGYRPDWSPDGGRIVFAKREGNETNMGSSIWIVNANGTNLKKLTLQTKFYDIPKWSHDGKKIVFQSWEDTKNKVWLMNRDGSNQKELVEGWTPSWTPDDRIAFIQNSSGNYELTTINTDGTDEKKIFSKPFKEFGETVWSPDGTKIAFSDNRSGNYDIFVVDVDGSNERQLTNDIKDEWTPLWSPDGTKIAYTKFVRRLYDGGEVYDIMVMNSNGGSKIRLNNEDGFQLFPSWSPDGKKIAYLKNGDIWVMNLKPQEIPAPASKSAPCFEGFLAIACTGAALLLRKR